MGSKKLTIRDKAYRFDEIQEQNRSRQAKYKKKN